MNTLGAIVIAILSTIGLIAVVQMVFDTLLSPVKPQNGECIYTVIKASGRMDDMQMITKALLRAGDSWDMKIIIADAGMNDEARSVAERICRDSDRVEVTSIDELCSYICKPMSQTP